MEFNISSSTLTERPNEEVENNRSECEREAESAPALPVSIQNDVPVKFRAMISRSYAGIGSPRSAIKAKCAECCGFEEVYERVGNCTTRRCPLWMWRPYQDRAKSEGGVA
jgi:hypothetical protein